MASAFRRSVSLPDPNPREGGPKPEKHYHVRSTSLPCRSHPLVARLDDEVRATRAWQPAELAEAVRPSAAWLRSGLIRLELLHLALDDLLQMPQTRELLSRSCGLAEDLLDGFLRFADAYGSFRSALVSLHELQSAAQVAARRKDAALLSSVARSLRKTEKDVAGLSSVLRGVSTSASAVDVELVQILGEVKRVTVSVSAAVFQGTAAALVEATAAVAPRSPSWTALRRRLRLMSSSKKKKGESCTEGAEEGEEWARRASERLEVLEECVVALESGSERVFRCLMNTRVSLLNILTP